MGLPVTPYSIPAGPPDDLLAELDAAGRRLDELSARAVRLVLDMDEQARSLRIDAVGAHGALPLSPRQLLDLLNGDALPL
jgi:hypothetical protein